MLPLVHNADLLSHLYNGYKKQGHVDWVKLNIEGKTAVGFDSYPSALVIKLFAGLGVRQRLTEGSLQINGLENVHSNCNILFIGSTSVSKMPFVRNW